jgi:hypothetical protein
VHDQRAVAVGRDRHRPLGPRISSWVRPPAWRPCGTRSTLPAGRPRPPVSGDAVGAARAPRRRAAESTMPVDSSQRNARAKLHPFHHRPTTTVPSLLARGAAQSRSQGWASGVKEPSRRQSVPPVQSAACSTPRASTLDHDRFPSRLTAMPCVPQAASRRSRHQVKAPPERTRPPRRSRPRPRPWPGSRGEAR